LVLGGGACAGVAYDTLAVLLCDVPDVCLCLLHTRRVTVLLPTFLSPQRPRIRQGSKCQSWTRRRHPAPRPPSLVPFTSPPVPYSSPPERDAVVEPTLSRCRATFRRHTLVHVPPVPGRGPPGTASPCSPRLRPLQALNDSRGHRAEDQLLVAIPGGWIGSEERRHRRPGGQGDEFAFLGEGCQEGSAAGRVADRVQRELAQPSRSLGQEVFTSAQSACQWRETPITAPGTAARRGHREIRAKAEGSQDDRLRHHHARTGGQRSAARERSAARDGSAAEMLCFFFFLSLGGVHISR